jgi:hypothetical protein
MFLWCQWVWKMMGYSRTNCWSCKPLPVTVNTNKKLCVNSATDNYLSKTLLVNMEVHLHLFSKCIFVNWKYTYISSIIYQKNGLQIIVHIRYSAKWTVLWYDIQFERLRNIHMLRHKQYKIHKVHVTWYTQHWPLVTVWWRADMHPHSHIQKERIYVTV